MRSHNSYTMPSSRLDQLINSALLAHSPALAETLGQCNLLCNIRTQSPQVKALVCDALFKYIDQMEDQEADIDDVTIMNAVIREFEKKEMITCDWCGIYTDDVIDGWGMPGSQPQFCVSCGIAHWVHVKWWFLPFWCRRYIINCKRGTS